MMTNDDLKKITEVFYLTDGWHAMYKGKLCPATFNSKGAALAWISVCKAKDRFRW